MKRELLARWKFYFVNAFGLSQKTNCRGAGRLLHKELQGFEVGVVSRFNFYGHYAVATAFEDEIYLRLGVFSKLLIFCKIKKFFAQIQT